MKLSQLYAVIRRQSHQFQPVFRFHGEFSEFEIP